MTDDHSKSGSATGTVDDAQRRKPGRPPLLIVLGFLAAFAATVLTVILTGLLARAPSTARSSSADAPRPAESAPAAQADNERETPPQE